MFCLICLQIEKNPHLWVVDGEKLERVDGDKYGPDIGVDEPSVETKPQIVQQSLLVQISQLAEIGVLLVLGWLVQKSVKVVLDELGVGDEPVRPVAVVVALLQAESVLLARLGREGRQKNIRKEYTVEDTFSARSSPASTKPGTHEVFIFSIVKNMLS